MMIRTLVVTKCSLASKLWHRSNEVSKPDLVRQHLLLAPVLPIPRPQEAESVVRREQKDPSVHGRIAELKLITPHYQHVEGTILQHRFASAIACTSS